MKKTTLLLFFVTAVVFANAETWAVSFIGQNGAAPAARNITFTEWERFVFEAKPIDNLAWNKGFSYEFMAKHIDAPSEIAKTILVMQLNSINNNSSLLWVDDNENPAIIDAEAAREIIRAKVTRKHLDTQKKYKFFSVSFNGSEYTGDYGLVERFPYREDEEFFVLTARDGSEYVLTSALCGNPVPGGAMLIKQGSNGDGGWERFQGGGEDNHRRTVTTDTLSYGSVTIVNNNNITVEGATFSNVGNSSVSNAGNSTVTPAATTTTTIPRDWSDVSPAPQTSPGVVYTTPTPSYRQPVSISIGADPYRGAYFGVSSSKFNLDLNSGPWWNWARNMYGYNNGCYNYNQCGGQTYRPQPGPSPHDNGGFVPNGTGSPATPGNNGHFVPNGTGPSYQGGGGGSFNPNGGG